MVLLYYYVDVLTPLGCVEITGDESSLESASECGKPQKTGREDELIHKRVLR